MDRWIADMDTLVLSERQPDNSYRPSYAMTPLPAPPEVPSYSELAALHHQLGLDFERLLTKTERYEHALKEIAAGPVSAGQAYIAKEALEPR